GYRPGPAPRALAYMGLSAYEACISGMPEYNSLESRYAGLNIPDAADSEYHWPTVINASYAYLMPRFFGGATADQLQSMSTLANINESKFKSQASSDLFERSKRRGEDVAAAIWAWAKTDPVGHEHYKDPFQGYNWETAWKKEGDWKPTFPGPGKPMGGIWGGARTFALKSSELLCRKPLPYSTAQVSDLYSQALEVYAQNTPTLSYEDEWVSEFWSDDLVNLTFSPGPRWLAIGDQVLVNEKSNLETAILMNAKVGMALNDASVSCWYSKYYYNVERPQTYINRVIDPNWKPSLINPLTGDQGLTPSFPAYPSGHSTMGAAGAEALASVFGYSYAMTDNCHANRTEFEGKPRSFGSFLEMAQENAWSRVPLGVHFRMDSEEGVYLGTNVGRKVNALPWKK
ncbi:MAG TPA: vanadium-dependent haloperoxidase, partial [Saprospiraceae bacterium]|nr:vanadium-dependent haloperoxidase [Saprospiraceae bacterium]